VARVVQADFAGGAYDVSQLPSESLPEVAFAGRSNAGKSSLLNRLLGRRHLVKVSATPGFTQSINFFAVNGRAYFVDLPGYGFARAPHRVQRKWHGLVEAYLAERGPLRGVVCILDFRRVPDRLDLDLIDFLRGAGRPIWVAFNKADKVSQPRRAGQLRKVCQPLPPLPGAPFLVSARTGEGVPELFEALWNQL